MMGCLEECALGSSPIDLEHCYWTFVLEMNCLHNKSPSALGVVKTCGTGAKKAERDLVKTELLRQKCNCWSHRVIDCGFFLPLNISECVVEKDIAMLKNTSFVLCWC